MEMMGRVVRVWMGGRVEEKKRGRREGSGNDYGLDGCKSWTLVPRNKDDVNEDEIM